MNYNICVIKNYKEEQFMERLQELDILIKDQENKSDEAWEIASAIIKRANEK